MAASLEPAPANGAHYERQGDEGILFLRGAVDIFEAQAVHAAASQTLADGQAAFLRVDHAGVQRLDLSALQILAALRRDLAAADRRLADGPENIRVLEAAAARAGLDLCSRE